MTANPSTDKTKNLLIKKIKKRDLSPFLDWLEARKKKYYKIAWAYLYNHHDVEDVFQSTSIKVYESIHQLKEEKYFETWVTSIFLNECRSLLRRKKREIVVEDLRQEGEVHNKVRERNMKTELKERLNKLEDIHREAIILKYISGYSQEEIGKILGVPVGTVKSRIYRGLKALKQEIEKEV